MTATESHIEFINDGALSTKGSFLYTLSRTDFDGMAQQDAYDLGSEAVEFGLSEDELGRSTKCLASCDFKRGYVAATRDRNVKLIVKRIYKNHEDYGIDHRADPYNKAIASDLYNDLKSLRLDTIDTILNTLLSK